MQLRPIAAAVVLADFILVAVPLAAHAEVVNYTGYIAPMQFATSTGSFGPRTVETVLRNVRIPNPEYAVQASLCRTFYSGFARLPCFAKITHPQTLTVKQPFVIDSGVVEGSQRSTKKWDEDTGWIGLDLGVTSAAGKLKTSGEVGLALDYTLNTGTVTPELSYSAQAHVPNAKSVEAGEFFSLGSSSGVDAGTIQATSPTAKLSVDAIFEIASSVSGRACIGVSPFATCSSRIL